MNDILSDIEDDSDHELPLSSIGNIWFLSNIKVEKNEDQECKPIIGKSGIIISHQNKSKFNDKWDEKKKNDNTEIDMDLELPTSSMRLLSQSNVNKVLENEEQECKPINGKSGIIISHQNKSKFNDKWDEKKENDNTVIDMDLELPTSSMRLLSQSNVNKVLENEEQECKPINGKSGIIISHQNKSKFNDKWDEKKENDNTVIDMDFELPTSSMRLLSQSNVNKVLENEEQECKPINGKSGIIISHQNKSKFNDKWDEKKKNDNTVIDMDLELPTSSMRLLSQSNVNKVLENEEQECKPINGKSGIIISHQNKSKFNDKWDEKKKNDNTVIDMDLELPTSSMRLRSQSNVNKVLENEEQECKPIIGKSGIIINHQNKSKFNDKWDVKKKNDNTEIDMDFELPTSSMRLLSQSNVNKVLENEEQECKSIIRKSKVKKNKKHYEQKVELNQKSKININLKKRRKKKFLKSYQCNRCSRVFYTRSSIIKHCKTNSCIPLGSNPYFLVVYECPCCSRIVHYE